MTHDLFLVRHAEAISRGSHEPDDERWLTPEGRRSFYKAARRLAHKVGKHKIDAIVTSPLPRAVMTAELLARALRLSGPVEVSADLGPAASLDTALALVSGQRRCIAAVGHEPLLSLLLHRLLGGETGEGGQSLGEIDKGAIVSLRPQGPGHTAQATLRHVIAPKQ